MVRKVKEIYPNKTIWAYTGFLFDRDIMEKQCNLFEETKELLSYIDVLVDGKFEMAKKNPNLRFRGSSNQRVIDVSSSLLEGRTVELKIDNREALLC